MKELIKALTLVFVFTAILIIFRGPMDTGYWLIFDVFSALCWTYIIQFLPSLRVFHDKELN